MSQRGAGLKNSGCQVAILSIQGTFQVGGSAWPHLSGTHRVTDGPGHLGLHLFHLWNLPNHIESDWPEFDVPLASLAYRCLVENGL